MNWFFRIWWITLFIKLTVSALLPLASDEAYYWVWSHNLQWSYFDHPVMVAVLYWLGHPLENFASAVRWPGVIMGHLTILIWFQLLKNRLDQDQFKNWLCFAWLTPLIGFGSMLVTPDIPLLFFWALACLFFEKALQEKETPRAALWYTLLGVALGLGFCSKYHIVLFIFIIFGYLSFERQWSRVRLTLLPLTVLAGIAASFPVLYWNYLNHWASFRFQIAHGFTHEHSWEAEWTLSFVAGQILLLSPLLIPSFFRGARDKSLRFYLWSAGFVWAFFLIASFRSVVEANWAIAAFFPAYVIVVEGLKSNWTRDITCGFWLLILTAFLSHLCYPWIPGLPNNVLDSSEYRSLVPFAKKYEPFYVNTYQMASVLGFELKKPVHKLIGMSRLDFFDSQAESKPQEKRFYIFLREGQSIPDWLEAEDSHIEVVDSTAPNFIIMRVDRR